jgi:hypothetical protein
VSSRMNNWAAGIASTIWPNQWLNTSEECVTVRVHPCHTSVQEIPAAAEIPAFLSLVGSALHRAQASQVRELPQFNLPPSLILISLR